MDIELVNNEIIKNIHSKKEANELLKNIDYYLNYFKEMYKIYKELKTDIPAKEDNFKIDINNLKNIPSDLKFESIDDLKHQIKKYTELKIKSKALINALTYDFIALETFKNSLLNTNKN